MKIFSFFKKLLNIMTPNRFVQKKLLQQQYIDAERAHLEKLYKSLMIDIKKSTSFKQLRVVKQKITQYKVSIDKIGSPAWGKNNIVFLESFWVKKFNLWKLQIYESDNDLTS